jgi:hypothetical protein
MTYFIIGNRDPRTVWHYIRREWCVDYDAEYGQGFEYSSYQAARQRADALRANPTCIGLKDVELVDIVTRDRLFEMLDVRDWAGPSR